jgi:hypothetical protein
LLFSPHAFEVHTRIIESERSEKRRREEAGRRDTRAASDRYTRGLSLLTLDGKWKPFPAPSSERIARHVKRYGSDGVEEMTLAYGGKGKGDVASLRERGFSVAEIATTLNRSEKSVSRALSALQKSESQARRHAAPVPV